MEPLKSSNLSYYMDEHHDPEGLSDVFKVKEVQSQD